MKLQLEENLVRPALEMASRCIDRLISKDVLDEAKEVALLFGTKPNQDLSCQELFVKLLAKLEMESLFSREVEKLIALMEAQGDQKRLSRSDRSSPKAIR